MAMSTRSGIMIPDNYEELMKIAGLRWQKPLADLRIAYGVAAGARFNPNAFYDPVTGQPIVEEVLKSDIELWTDRWLKKIRG